MTDTDKPHAANPGDLIFVRVRYGAIDWLEQLR